MSIINKWTTENIPDQTGKTVIVTGANSGLGFETTLALVQKGANVIMACRDRGKGEAAAEKVRIGNPQGTAIFMPLDLADLSSVRDFAAVLINEYPCLDILINNAGVMAPPYGQTVDGFEMQLGINHFGHFALTGLLFDLLVKTPNSRVVTVSSYAYLFGRIKFNDLNSTKFYLKWMVYCQSKLANMLFAYELQRRLSQNGGNPISVAVHPGYAATNLQRASTVFTFLNPIVGQSQAMGALPSLYAATSPEIKGGDFVGPDGFLGQHGYPQKIRSRRGFYFKAVAGRMWEVSEEMTGVRFGI
jgi:NAD(P)-dependent dehydrogenase (short-subunit alcohol dehydrogenase family)